jgi:hypothetical protein
MKGELTGNILEKDHDVSMLLEEVFMPPPPPPKSVGLSNGRMQAVTTATGQTDIVAVCWPISAQPCFLPYPRNTIVETNISAMHERRRFKRSTWPFDSDKSKKSAISPPF